MKQYSTDDPSTILRRREREDAARLIDWWRDLWRGLGELRRAMLDAIRGLLLPSARLTHPTTLAYLGALHKDVTLFGWRIAGTVGEGQYWALRLAGRAPTFGVTRQGHVLDTLADGTSLYALGPRYAAEAVAATRKALLLPTVGVRALAAAVEPVKDRALLTARNEVYRAYRAGTLAIYRDNGEAGWFWVSNLGPRTCGMCLAMHGTFHPIDEPFASHASCRCRMSLRQPRVSGVDWFAGLHPDVQRTILGPGKFLLWQSGRLTLADLVAETNSPRWGPGRAERPLSDFV